MFKRKKWKYMILDEAHHIKNFETKRWQTLLSFNTRRRLLLTGTPLQNNLMELWSLMHFLMPHIFQSHLQFKVCYLLKSMLFYLLALGVCIVFRNGSPTQSPTSWTG